MAKQKDLTLRGLKLKSGHLLTTPVYETYWKFAAERQAIFFSRLQDSAQPWTTDQILRIHKFTNAYRASDRVSQYLIRNVIYEGDQNPKEVFFRTILFKFFNKIETWNLLKDSFGVINSEDFCSNTYSKVLEAAMRAGKRIYSAAYIMPSGGKGSRYAKKHEMHLWLLNKMLLDGLPDQLINLPSMEEAFKKMLSYPSIGEFLAYQYVIDLNYGPSFQFSEMDFVRAGPGAKDGLRKCFLGKLPYTESDVIKIMADIQDNEFDRLGISFKSLWGRKLQLIDCQNLFCEVDKYSRVAHPEIEGITGRTKIKQKFSPNSSRVSPFYPPKWGINQLIESEVSYV
ncbi:MAG: nucleotide kinase domain-containing protein [Verrucomicrobiota bacterium]